VCCSDALINRPGAADVSEAEELQRVVPVIQALRSSGCTVPISIDTRRAAVARAAVSAGASLVNDISAGTHDPAMLPALAAAADMLGVPYVAMHMRGTPQTMTSCTEYANDVVSDVISELASQLAAAEEQGVPRWLLVCDPGVGFAKTAAQSLAVMAHLQRVSAELHCPLLIGPSRKRFIGAASGADDISKHTAQLSKASSSSSSSGSGSSSGTSGSAVAAVIHDRDWGTVGAVCSAVERGARIVRVHNVTAVKQAVRVVDAIRNAPHDGHQ
jgi:dihydropteroate synthase